MKVTKYFTDRDLNYVRSFLPTDVTVEADEVSMLAGGDFFVMTIRRYGASVNLQLHSAGDAIAEGPKQRVYTVEEDRYESRWTERFGLFDSAIRRAIELVRDPSKMDDLLKASEK